MVRPQIVRRKLLHLDGYLQELEPYREIAFEAYLAAGGPRRTIERLIQLTIETAVDVNLHVATEIEGRPSDGFREYARAVLGWLDRQPPPDPPRA